MLEAALIAAAATVSGTAGLIVGVRYSARRLPALLSELDDPTLRALGAQVGRLRRQKTAA